eukprot:2596094-Karenia_brevis.AAC.1
MLECDLPDEERDTLPFDDMMPMGVVQHTESDATTVVKPLSDQGAVEQEAHSWATWWGESTKYSLSPDALADVPNLPSLQHHALVEAAKSFPIDTGLGMDNWAPRALTRLPVAAILALCTILRAAETLGQWSEALNLVMIVLLPKPDGGLRPIG